MILHSQIFGEGEPFIFLHGFLGMGDNWKTLGKKFSDLGYQIHLVDQRNHGRSFHDDNFSYSLMADDLLNYLHFHKIEKCILLGHSMGGKTAMEFAMENPKMVEKLIIVDIGPKSYPPHHQDILHALHALNFENIETRGEAEEILGQYIPEAGVKQFLLKNLYRLSKDRFGLRINLKVLTDKYDEVGKGLLQNSQFSGPTLFVKGQMSGYLEDTDEILIKKYFPMASLATVSNAGHWLHAENPAEFYQILKDFL